MMNQGDLFRKLGSILNELNDQYEYLAQNPQKFNELELELFLANANFLADHIQIIRKLNNHKVPKELPEHTPEADIAVAEDDMDIPAPLVMEEEEEPAMVAPQEAPEPIVAHEATTFKVEPEPLSFEFILNERPQAESAELPHADITEVQQPVAEIHPVAEVNPPIQEKEAAPEAPLFSEEPEKPQQDLVEEIGPEPFLVTKAPLVTKEEDQVPPPTSSLVVDRVEEKLVKPTLNDLLASTRKKENTDPSAVTGPPITDLKQAINLNDKLLYIKDLFNGYNLAYSEAIELINKMPDFKTADAFLKNNYAVKNNWAVRPATVDKFYDLLRRRF